MAKSKYICDEGTAHLSKRFVYGMIKSFFILIHFFPPLECVFQG